MVRYSNRLEIRNAGYSLKPESMLGEMGSQLRNPLVAAVLYDLAYAETKGTGIRTMRRLLEEAGLTAPVFTSQHLENQFTAIYLLHQLLGEEQLLWLQQFSHLHLSDDEAKALILAAETGAMDNAALRAVSGLDTLSASQTLWRLHHQRRLLVKGGAGPSTYYQLAVLPELPLFQAGTGDPVQDAGEPMINADDLATDAGDLATNTGDLPEGLRRALDTLTPKARQERLWPVIVWLCAIRPHSAEQLGRLLDRQATHLKVKHLKPLRIEAGYLQYTHPEVINHPEQAYQTTAAGRAWLARQGIAP